MKGKIRIKVIGSVADTFGRAKSVLFRDRFDFSFDPSATEYDWLVVYNDIPRKNEGTYGAGFEPLACPRAHTIQATNEPVPVKYYGHFNTRQYAYFMTNRPFEPECHPGYRFAQGYYSWLTGRVWQDELNFVAPAKTKVISTICSAKSQRQAHYRDRYLFISRLSELIPEMDWFGWGVRRLDWQWQALDEYRYTVAVESHIAPGHWTEKIADAILSGCLTFYAGDPELGKVLPSESFIPIPIDDPARAHRIIRQAIADNAYEKHLPAIREARQRLLSKYNFCAQVCELVSAEERAPVKPDAWTQRIYGRHALRRHNPLAMLSDALHHLMRGR